MSKPIKILLIDPDYQVSYFILGNGRFIQSSVPQKTAIEMLKRESFDLIISEPHHRAVLSPQTDREIEKQANRISGSKGGTLGRKLTVPNGV